MNLSNFQSKYLPIFVSCVLFVTVLLFFALVYPNHLHYQEQYQLFLFDSEYFAEVLSIPGGAADWGGRFLVQFFLSAWAGAAIVALLLLSVFVLTLKRTRQGWFRPLALLPAIVLWAFVCDENALLGAVVAVVFAQWAEYGLSVVSDRRLRNVLTVVVAPLLYWLLGPVAVICPLIGLVSALGRRELDAVVSAVIALLLFVSMPWVVHLWVALPLDRLYLSPHYYRYPLMIPYWLWAATLLAVLVPILPATASNRWISLVLSLVVLCGGGTILYKVYNASSEEVMAYDFLARHQQWTRLIDTANKKKPNNSLSCTALNLALGMKGRIADHMFEYNQKGLDGLLPKFVRDPVSPLTTSEAFYQLGMINTAQCFVFEAQEAIPDYQKSARCYKRLAETNLISGNYAVARKYLLALEKTLFYRNWARKTMRLLGDEEAIIRHKEYGRLRSFMPHQDYMFSDRETPQMLGRQVLANRTNRLAYEYTVAAYLLLRDLDSFVNCIQLGANMGYLQMPMMHQQAFILWWSRDHTAQEQVPNLITPKVYSGMNQFYSTFQQKPLNKEKLQSRFGNTYWYYYFIH